jgi:hypothetical protein
MIFTPNNALIAHQINPIIIMEDANNAVKILFGIKINLFANNVP